MRHLAPLYDRLSPDERFRAAIDAIGRRDIDELGRLSETCPEKKYLCADVEYSQPLKAAWVIAALAGNALLQARLSLELPMFGHEYLEEISGPLAEFASALNPDAPFDTSAEWCDFRATIDAAYGEEVERLVGTCEGIQRFCTVIGVAPAKLLVLAPGAVTVWELGTRLSESHAPDEAVAQNVRQHLMTYWEAMVPSEEAEAGRPALEARRPRPGTRQSASATSTFREPSVLAAISCESRTQNCAASQRARSTGASPRRHAGFYKISRRGEAHVDADGIP
jgi:hypothetical protein